MSQCWLESPGRNIELSGGNLRKYIQDLKNTHISTSKFLPPPLQSLEICTQRHSASRTWSYRNNQRCVKAMNLFIALVFVREEKLSLWI